MALWYTAKFSNLPFIVHPCSYLLIIALRRIEVLETATDQLDTATDIESDMTVFINMWEVEIDDVVIPLKISKSIPGELFRLLVGFAEKDLTSCQSLERGKRAGYSVNMFFVDSHAFKALTRQEHRLLLCIKTFPHRLDLVKNEAKFLSIKSLAIGECFLKLWTDLKNR